MMTWRISSAMALVACALSGCGDDDASSEDAGARDAGVGADGGGVRPDAAADAGPERDGGSGLDASACGEAPAAPTERLVPASGELFYAQIGLGGLSIGESAIVVGPDGTTVLVDVGTDSHDDDVVDALAALAGGADVDHVVITHFHADHGDGIVDLLGRITPTGRIVHRGLTDFTPAANDTTIERVCDAGAAFPGMGVGLCAAASTAPCAPGSWMGGYPMVSCDGLDTADLALGSGAIVDFVAANGFIGGERYDTVVGPFFTDDSNGENARSVVAVVRHGAFRMLLTGDLTGGGSDTDDVESFYASRLEAAAGIDARGVDVLHAGHHGRNTSSNATWIDRLLPADGLSRNVVMGVSTAHVGSPHEEVLTAILSGGRLAAGAAWTTRVAATGATAVGLVDAQGGHVIVRTLDGGSAYAVQTVASDGTLLESRAFASVASCP